MSAPTHLGQKPGAWRTWGLDRGSTGARTRGLLHVEQMCSPLHYGAASSKPIFNVATGTSMCPRAEPGRGSAVAGDTCPVATQRTLSLCCCLLSKKLQVCT